MTYTMMPNQRTASEITDVIGSIPYRMAFAGGWIDQPFMSQAESESAGLDGGGVVATHCSLHGVQWNGHQFPESGNGPVGQ